MLILCAFCSLNNSVRYWLMSEWHTFRGSFWNLFHGKERRPLSHRKFKCSLNCIIQSESVARGPKLLSIKNYVIEIMTWKFIYTYWEWCKTGPAHNRCWNWHTWMRFSKFWNTFPKVSMLTAWISWHMASFSRSIVRGVFLYTLPFNSPQRKKSAGVRSASPCL